MAYYTHDGLRHTTKEEALHYLESFITTVSPFNDDYVKQIHGHDWNKYEVQCIPEETESIYVELIRNYTHLGNVTGFNQIRYYEAVKPEVPEDVIDFLSRQTSILDMINSEVRSSLVEWSQDEKHLDISDDENSINLSLTMAIQHSNDNGEPDNNLFIEYTLDEVITGMVNITERDPLSALLLAIESHILLEVEGELQEDSINGYNVFHIIDSAQREDMTVSIKLSEKVSETQE